MAVHAAVHTTLALAMQEKTSQSKDRRSYRAVRLESHFTSTAARRALHYKSQVPERKPGCRTGQTVCSIDDFIGGDLVGFDLGQWCDDVEKYGAIGFYAPPEGGAECRYATSLKYRGYHLMNVSARGLGDVEAYLTKTHGVRPAHLGKQAVARFFIPGEVDYRLSVLPPRYKGIVVWVGEAKVLSKNELQFLALLPALRPNVKVVVELGGSRKFNWKPLVDTVGLPPASMVAPAAAAAPLPMAMLKAEEKPKEEVLVTSA